MFRKKEMSMEYSKYVSKDQDNTPVSANSIAGFRTCDIDNLPNCSIVSTQQAAAPGTYCRDSCP